MNKYMQTDSRWGSLGYPKTPYCLNNCGCGEVSICNIIIETAKYVAETPKTILPYCVQYADPNGNGTYWSGIPAMMKHYGLTEVQEHATMKPLWNELAKGNRVAVFLMGSRPGGTKGVHWTSSGHFVCGTGYKYENGKHYVYVKDSYSNSPLRNGWLSYEENMRNDVLKVWSGKLPSEVRYKPTTPYTGKLPKGAVKKGDKGDDVERVRDFINWYYGRHIKHGVRAGSTTDKYIRIFQKENGLDVDGIFGEKTKAKAKEVIKKYAPTLADKILDACKTQAEWMKNYVYGWQADPTIEKSKKKGTCVTFVACVLQRLGYLKPGECIWHNGKGKVSGTNDKMTVTYPKNKKVSDLKDFLQAGDIVIAGDPKSTEAGGNSHIFIVTGKWKGNDPYIWDNRSADRIKAGKNGLHTYSGARKVIAVIRLKKTSAEG